MAQPALDSLPQSTLEEKFSALEARFGALEKKYHDLHERTFTLTENSTGESTEVAIPKQLHTANEESDGSGDPPEEGEKETGPKSRADIVINRFDPKSGERKDYSPSDPSPVTPHVTDTSRAFTLRKNVFADTDDNDGEINVINQHLWDLLKAQSGHLPLHIFQGPPVTLESPYELLILCWEKLQQAAKEVPKDENDKQWAQLQTKNMILNLVKGHGTSDPARDDGLEVDDIISKKGKGLVILLYGPPGVGKTSTAETVAIATRKPLFAISVADVGTKAKNVEANLAKIFALATSWQAILLIDEADVFLESRGKGITSNTERNALVSVFLRVLEYYQGILVLTTNQIAQFDVAVQSRIHVAIKYVNLDDKQTMAIFEGFLKPLAERGLVKDMDNIREWLLEDVVKMGLDGRQIRNIITSALGLARAQGKTRLERNDIKMMLNNVKDFKDEFIKQYEKYKSEQQGMIG